jgi:hypothetical protein
LTPPALSPIVLPRRVGSCRVLFFIDESWQKISGERVGALGAVAIEQSKYNQFCREFFRLKRDVLGATELNHSEIRGQHAFTKAVFRRQELHGDSHWLKAVDGMFNLLERHGARTFVIWTDEPAYVDLRNADPAALSDTCKKLLYDFRCLMREVPGNRFGSLNFDQRSYREDETAACAIQNFIVRTHTQGEWRKLFIQVPNFTVSAVSPGLQSADVVAHLAPHLANPEFRAELKPYVDRALELAYQAPTRTRRRRPCVTYIAGTKRKRG